MAPPEKKQKTEEEAAEFVEETDAKKDSAPKISGAVTFLTPDTTMNVLPSSVGNMLMSMSEGGLSQLVAGARANVGVKSGRYMFEAKIVEVTGGQKMCRVGFAAEGSLFVGEDDNSIGFDADGNLVGSRKKTKCSAGFGRDVIIAVVLNLDEKSPHFNTISLFKDGKRACKPQPLPESMQGKTLYPAISFKTASVHFNFGTPAVPLPFKCRVIGEASTKDAEIQKYPEPSDGKYTVLFPVSMPDEGSFDWLDNFLESNANFTELSDRAFTDWALKSGLHSKGPKKSNDKPDQTDISDMANIKKILMEVASMQPRNFVVMEVKGNLVKEERARAVARFSGNPIFKTLAEVVVSDPPSAFRRLVQTKTLKAKQDEADKQQKLKYLEEKKQWTVRKKTKEMEKLKKKKEKEMKKRAEEAKLNRERSLKKAQKEMAKKKAIAEGKVPPEDDEEEKPIEVAMSEDEDEPEEPEPQEKAAAKVSLTAEEKAVKFFKHPQNDIADHAFGLSFTKFSLPEDGEFDSVKYSWAKEKEAAAYLKDWILQRKQTTRVEDITPSAWFKQKQGAWKAESDNFKKKVEAYKQEVAKKEQAKRAKAAAKALAEKKAKAEAEKAEKDGEKAEKKEEKPAEVVEDDVDEEPEVDFDAVEVFGVDDVTNVGGGVPLQKEFGFEDYALLQLRVRLHLLVHSFSKDCSDPDRTGIHLDHLGFYYQKYFSQALNFSEFGVSTAAELCGLVNDAVHVNKNILETLVPAELESFGIFVKITESARRRRRLLVDMGDESAKLKVKQQGGGDNGGSWKGGGGGQESWGGKKSWGGGWGGKKW